MLQKKSDGLVRDLFSFRLCFSQGKHRMVVDVKIEGLSRSDEDMEAKSEEIA